MPSEAYKWATQDPLRDQFKFQEDDSFSTKKHCCKSCEGGEQCEEPASQLGMVSYAPIGLRGQNKPGGRGRFDPIGPHDPDDRRPVIPPLDPDLVGGGGIGPVPWPPFTGKRKWRRTAFGPMAENYWWNQLLLTNLKYGGDLRGAGDPTGETFYIWDKMINPDEDAYGNIHAECIVQLYCLPLDAPFWTWRHCYLIVMDCSGDIYQIEITQGFHWPFTLGNLAENGKIIDRSDWAAKSPYIKDETKRYLYNRLVKNHPNYIGTVYTDCLSGDLLDGTSPCECLIEKGEESRGIYFPLGPNSNSYITDLLLACDIPLGVPTNAPGRSFSFPVGAYTRDGQAHLNAAGLLGARGGPGGLGVEVLGLDTGLTWHDGFEVSLLGIRVKFW